MGWFSSLFKRSEPVEVPAQAPQNSTLPLSAVPEWLKEKEKELILQHHLEEEAQIYLNQLKDKRWFLENKIGEWEKKILALGLSHRSQDVSTVFTETKRLFEPLDTLRELKIKNLLDFSSKLQPRLEELQRKIENSSFAYNYSFLLPRGQERLSGGNPLLQQILELSASREAFEEKVIKSGFSKVAFLQGKADSLQVFVPKIKILEDNLKVKKERLQKAEEFRDEKRKELLSMRENPQFSQLSDAGVRREKLLRNLEENEEIIHGFFSKIKPALRKMPFLGGGSNNKLIDDYLMDALKTFHQDNHLEIIKILQQLKKALADEQIKLDADQANQIYEFLEKAEQGYLLELKNKHKELQDELEGLQNFSNNKDFQMKIGEAKYRVEHYHQQVERFQEEFESVQNELKEQMTLLQKEIEHFKSTVKISLDQEIEINI